ncbi:MAG: hypothetical protein JXA20_03015 [Spirochaetes bacterium]|nr:hypothetical protein [Spirochaetota bacterium]
MKGAVPFFIAAFFFQFAGLSLSQTTSFAVERGVLPRALTVTASGKSCVFWYSKHNKEYVSINGSVAGPYDGVDWMDFMNYIPEYYSPDETQFGYLFKKDGKDFIAVNKKVHGPFSWARPPRFFRNGEGYWFNAHTADSRPLLYLNGRELGEETMVPSVTDDGRGYGYYFRKGGKEYYCVNGNNYGPYDIGQSMNSPALRSGGSKFGFSYSVGGKSYVNVSGTVYGPYQWALMPAMSDGGDTFSFYYKKGGRYYVCVNGTEYEGHDMVHSHAVSGDGSAFAFVFTKKNRYYVNVNGTVHGDCDYIQAPTFSKNGAAFAYIFKKGYREEHVSLNGTDLGGHEEVYSNWGCKHWRDGIALSGDGKGYGYAYREGRSIHVRMNGKVYRLQGNAESILKKQFNSTVSEFAYILGGGEGDVKRYVKTSSRSFGPYTSLVDFSFTPDGNLAIASIRGNSVMIQKVVLRK